CESISVLGVKCASAVDTDVCVRASSGSAAADASSPTGTAPGAILEGGTEDVRMDVVSPPPPAPDGPSGDAGVSCTEDQEGNDHHCCNGEEKCVAGRAGKPCRPGAPADGARCGDDSSCIGGSCRSLSTCNLSGNWAMKIVAHVTWTG